MNPHCFLHRCSHSRTYRCASALLIMLAWSGLAAGGDINDAVKNGDLEKVKVLLKENPQLLPSKDDRHGWTPLHCAAFYGQKDVAKFLLADGADINAKDRSGMTPLHLTAFDAQSDVAELLLANKADVDNKNKFGKTPLHEAASRGQIGVAKLLLAHGAKINAAEDAGMSPLHEAAYNGHKDMVEFLLANGAEIDGRTVDGKTALHLAAGKGDKAVVELLLEKKARINATDKNGVTPLRWAETIFWGSSEDIQEAMEPTKAEIKARGGNNGKPFHDAVAAGYDATVKLLLQRGGHE